MTVRRVCPAEVSNHFGLTRTRRSALFKKLKEDALTLYSQFEVREDTIDAMLWPADSYAKTQIYKLNHFLMLYHEGRCRELVDIVKGLINLLRAVCEEQWGEPMDVEGEVLD